jgi:hypothetical protein
MKFKPKRHIAVGGGEESDMAEGKKRRVNALPRADLKRPITTARL